MVKLGQDHVRDWKIPCPPLLEQLAIADYISRETQQLDRMVEKIEEAIERLHDYRAALITAAVTGKIDVRGQSADNRPVLASPP
jgi:type I restriction enzyme S subunit